MIGQLSTTQTLQLIRYRKPLQLSGRDSKAAVFRLQLMKSTMLVWLWRFAFLNNYTIHCQTVTRLTRGMRRRRQCTMTRNKLPEFK